MIPYPKVKPHFQEIYCFKGDIAKCFPSINHSLLLKIISNKIGDKKVLWLLKEIISSFETGDEFDFLFPADSPFIINRPRGIPIGNLTSQLFMNIFLNELDQYLKHQEKVRFYLRYVDDFVILHPDKKYLHQLRELIRIFLREKLFLELHPKKQSIFPIKKGIDFLGHVVFKDFSRLRKSNKEAFRKKLKKMKKNLLKSKENEEKMRQAITSWLAHASFSRTERLKKRMLGWNLEAKNQEFIKRIISVLKTDLEQRARASSVQLGLFDTLPKPLKHFSSKATSKEE